MWIQSWRPGIRRINRYAVWKEHDGLYFSCWRSDGPGHRATLLWHVTRTIVQDGSNIYHPPYPTRILFEREDYRGRSKQLHRRWAQIMADPSAFLMEVLL